MLSSFGQKLINLNDIEYWGLFTCITACVFSVSFV